MVFTDESRRRILLTGRAVPASPTEVIMSANDRLGRLLTAISIVLCAFGAAQAPKQPESARIVFEGTITEVGATTSKQFPDASNCVVVRVDRFLRLPDELSEDLAEYKLITVKVLKPDAAKVGKRGRFYTSVWRVGDEIAVAEKAGPDDPRSRLAVRLAAADVVFVGTVISVRPAARDPKQKVTEHDPAWMDAVVTVESRLKGDVLADQKQLTVRFAGSDDVLWADSPKFKKDQHGIWVLNKDHKRGQFIATDPADFQPDARLDEIKKLLPR
jgi:hypothetical protein